MFALRLLAVGAVATAGAGGAFAQGCDTPGGCGHSPLFGTGALFAPNKHLARYPDANSPRCATKTYPISDWKYISKYCGPTLNPGTSYGFSPTKWRRWDEACPTGIGYAAILPSPIIVETAPTTPMPMPTPSTPLPLPMPMPAPISPAKDPIPNVSQEAASISVAPAPLPMIGVIPVIPAEHGKFDGAAPMLPLRTLPSTVVPPVRDFPERSRN